MSDLDEVLKVLGVSFFLGDLRTDLKKVRHTIDNAPEYNYFNKTIPGDPNRPNVEDSASVNVVNACFHAVCGRFIHAFESLRLAQASLSLLPRRWAIHVKLIDIYLQFLRRYPTATDFRADGGIAREVRNLATQYPHNIHETMASVMEMTRELGEPSPIDALEFFSLLDLLTSRANMDVAYILHPAYPDHGFRTGNWQQERTELINRRISHLQMVQERAGVLQSVPTYEYTLILVYLYLHGSYREEAVHVLSGLESMYEAADLANGRAMCKMLAADRILSPPWTSPIAFNLIPVDNVGIKITNHIWDSFEDNVMLTTTVEIDRLYQEAYDLFHKGDCARGRAAILLRQAAIRIACFNSFTIEDKLDWHEEVEEIGARLKNAFDLFVEDEARQQIVLGHQLLLNILTGADDKCLNDTARRISHWSLQNDNEGVAQFVGFLFLRFGRRQWLDHNRIEIAGQCFQAAHYLFLELGDTISAVKAIAALIEVLDNLSDHTTAKVLLYDNKQHFMAAMHRIDQYFMLSSDIDQKFSFLQQRKGLLVDCLPMAASIFSFADDHKEYERWEAMVTDLSVPSETHRTFLETQATPEMQNELYGDDRRDSHLRIRETLSISLAFRKATGAYARLMRQNRLEEAVKLMKDSTQDIKNMPGSERHKHITLIQINFMIGNLDECRRHLALLSEQRLIGDLTLRQMPAVMSDALWCRNRWSSRLAYPTDASVVISICAMAHAWNQAQDVMDKVLQVSPGFYDLDGPDRVIDQSPRFSGQD